MVNLVVVFELLALGVEGNDHCLFCRAFSVGSMFPALLPPFPFCRGLTPFDNICSIGFFTFTPIPVL